jgi:DNA-binding NarL/FixJ family response regulator
MMTTAARVAIVDDHPKFRAVMREVIDQMADVDVAWEAGDALAALDNIATDPVELVVIDLSLPGINGIELIRRLDRGWPGVASLVVTGHTEQAYVDDAFGAGALAYVLKGRPAELRAAVTAALAGQRYASPRVQPSDHALGASDAPTRAVQRASRTDS